MEKSLRKNKIDIPLLVSCGFLLLFGLIILSSASSGVGILRFNNTYHYLQHQLLYGLGVGAILFLLGIYIPYNRWQKWAIIILLLSVILSILVFIPGVGFHFSGAQRWIHIGGVSIQPSELLKFSFIIYLSAWLANRRTALHSFFHGFLPFIILTGIIGILLILQPDIGTLGVLLFTALSLFFVAGGKLKQVGLAVVLGMLAFVALVIIEPYRLNRVRTLLNPEYNISSTSYQINQALQAIQSGGISGKGLGFSTQKFRNLPEPMGDSIFAVTAEETGFIGSMTLIGLLMFFVLRIFYIATQTKDMFGRLLVSGIGFLIFWQTFINIGAISGILPLTGIPLPFISYGGTALAFLLGGIGIIMNISKHNNKFV